MVAMNSSSDADSGMDEGSDTETLQRPLPSSTKEADREEFARRDSRPEDYVDQQTANRERDRLVNKEWKSPLDPSDYDEADMK